MQGPQLESWSWEDPTCLKLASPHALQLLSLCSRAQAPNCCKPACPRSHVLCDKPYHGKPAAQLEGISSYPARERPASATKTQHSPKIKNTVTFKKPSVTLFTIGLGLAYLTIFCVLERNRVQGTFSSLILEFSSCVCKRSRKEFWKIEPRDGWCWRQAGWKCLLAVRWHQIEEGVGLCAA